MNAAAQQKPSNVSLARLSSDKHALAYTPALKRKHVSNGLWSCALWHGGVQADGGAHEIGALRPRASIKSVRSRNPSASRIGPRGVKARAWRTQAKAAQP